MDMSQTASPRFTRNALHTLLVLFTFFIAAVASTLYSHFIGDMDLRKWVAALTNVIVFKIALSQHVRLGASRRTIFLIYLAIAFSAIALYQLLIV
jgi:hypothetical protein